MSQLLVQQYLNQLQDLRKVCGSHREAVVRESLKDLLKEWARTHDLVFVSEHEIAAPTWERRYVEGALMYALRVPFDDWEAKDDKDSQRRDHAHRRRDEACTTTLSRLSPGEMEPPTRCALGLR